MNETQILAIPGPTPVDPKVLRVLSKPTLSHRDPVFTDLFGETLRDLKEIFLCKSGQAVVVAGSGTLAMEMSVVNFLEEEDRLLVVNTGYFGDRFVEIFSRYGVKIDQLKVPVGHIPSKDQVREALEKEDYKLLTVQHVDTSIGVANDIKGIGEVANDFDTLVVVDGVCSISGCEFRQDDWNIDVCFTGSQKALAVPPGLAIVMVNEKAIQVLRKKNTPTPNYYCDLSRWLPIMDTYERGDAGYFATPPVNMIYSLHESLKQILDEGLEERIQRHSIISRAVKAAVNALSLDCLPISNEIAANTVTAPFFPPKVESKRFHETVRREGVVLARGVQKELRDKYFRIGHMGNMRSSEILAIVGAIEKGLSICGYEFQKGLGLTAAGEVLTEL
jgi:alanine-glyoxylate transaminase/serine-glyoxylate transaminase/serine-pyruvate transaminase